MNKQFDKPLPHRALDLNDKGRSNIFAWRGQFTPELVENLIEAYCPNDSVILDPFCGSGTVICEAGYYEHRAIGVELNPAAYILSKTYELINLTMRERESLLSDFLEKFRSVIPEPEMLDLSGHQEITYAPLKSRISKLRKKMRSEELLLLEALVILLDLNKHPATSFNIYSTLYKLTNAVKQFPSSSKPVAAVLGDARSLPLSKDSIDFVITSPPYINVFNYHQNYRKSAELLEWDLLKIAKSEIGSNRANRGNRFLTVTQYCLDMGTTLAELHRVCKSNARLIFVVGHESRVLGVPFFNAEIISALATESGLFDVALRQSRKFTNKFGGVIREDLLNLEKANKPPDLEKLEMVSRNVASTALREGFSEVPATNKPALLAAMKALPHTQNTPLCYQPNSERYKSSKSEIATGA